LPSVEGEESKREFTVSSNQRDVIGVGVDGNGNIIGKNISIVINEFTEACALTLIPPDYFEENTDTENDFKQWLKGYSFSLPSIYQRMEYRREKVISELKMKLENKRRLLLLGESGTSKSTLLREMICDYFDEGYRVLYNEEDELKGTNMLYSKIKGIIDAKERVLVVIDNVHSPKMAFIFNVVRQFQTLNAEKKGRLRFLLAARTPEFDWALERNLFEDTKIVQNIKNLFDNDFKIIVNYFKKQEVREFIEWYHYLRQPLIENKSIEQNTDEIFKHTEGYPIMVRYAVLNEGLSNHVEKMFQEFLIEKTKINLERLKVVMLNSLFDISNIPLKEDMLDKFGLLDIASNIQDTIIKKTGDIWKTIHTKWDIELFRHVFSLKYNLNYIEDSFKEIIKIIIINERISGLGKLNILNTVYYSLIKENVIKLNTIEKMINLKDIENNLDNSSKIIFYANVIGLSYDESGRNEEALDFYDKALEINPNIADAYSNKGNSLSKLGRYDEAIASYDKALGINPRYAHAYNGKGVSLSNLGREKEAIASYDKALEINPDYADAYSNKGNSLSKLGREKEALVEYDKALVINPNIAEAYSNKGVSLSNLGREKEAIASYDKALAITPKDVNTLVNKGESLSNFGRHEEARRCYDKALEIEPKYVDTLLEELQSYINLKRNEEAKRTIKTVLDIEPQNFVALRSRKKLEKED
jgi:tetratricopeptide (TPR) repeat protein